MIGPELDRLMTLLARLPGLGPRSARRVVLHLIRRRESLLLPLADALQQAAAALTPCSVCGNVDTRDPCQICQDDKRDKGVLCVVADVGDLWALERTSAYRGLYHVLGGTLSALDGRTPEQLSGAALVQRAGSEAVQEVILALSATVEGQTTAHYLADQLAECDVRITRLAHGVPMGGELDYLDDGTLTTALTSRRDL